MTVIKLDIDRLLSEKGWTATHLAERLGVHKSQITFLKQRSRVDLSMLAKLCEVFECEVADLFTTYKETK